jgi:hypothetical protein
MTTETTKEDEAERGGARTIEAATTSKKPQQTK